MQRGELVGAVRELWEQLGMKEEWDRQDGKGREGVEEEEEGRSVEEMIRSEEETEMKLTLLNLGRLQDKVAKLEVRVCVRA
jgi:hypothetical protein